MIDKNDVIRFFDRCAPFWDAEMMWCSLSFWLISKTWVMVLMGSPSW